MSVSKVEDKLFSVLNRLRKKHWYIDTILARIPIYVIPGSIADYQAAAWTDGRNIVLVQELVEKYDEESIGFVILHETLHIINYHVYRAKEVDNPKKFNVAADLEVNPICEQYFPNAEIKKGLLFPEMFNLPRGKWAEWYYKRLPEKPVIVVEDFTTRGRRQGEKKQPVPSPKEGEEKKKKEAEQEKTTQRETHKKEEEKKTKGEKSTHGKKEKEERKVREERTEAVEEVEHEKLSNEGEEGEVVIVDSWDEVLGRTPTGKDLKEPSPIRPDIQDIKRIVEDLRRFAKSWGLGDAYSYLTNVLEELVKQQKPEIDWRQYVLAWFHYKVLAPLLTWKRPRKRYYPMGVYLPSKKTIPLVNIVAVIDISGSMYKEEHAKIMAEIMNLLKSHVVRIKVLLLFCNTRVVEAKLVTRPEEVMEVIKNFPYGGGTGYKDAFEWIKKNARMYLPEGVDAILYLTDGYCQDIITASDAMNLPLLWIILVPAETDTEASEGLYALPPLVQYLEDGEVYGDYIIIKVQISENK